MKTLKGISVSPGIAIGTAKVFKKAKATASGELLQTGEAIAAGIVLFEQAIAVSVKEIEAMLQIQGEAFTPEEIAILETQAELLADPQLAEDVIELIRSERKNAADAVVEVVDRLVEVFRSMDDEYLQARWSDIRDAGDRILARLGQTTFAEITCSHDTILIAEDLTPTDAIGLDLRYITGFITQLGGKTSHTAIIARAKGLPAISGCGMVAMEIQDDDLVVMDGSTGEIFVNPHSDLIDVYGEKRSAFLHRTEQLKRLKDVEAITTDGFRITLSGNISGGDDLEDVFANGGEGAGLLRTELLFMNRDSFPGEEEQFAFYKHAALQAKGKLVVVRTLDIGGDKQLPYFELPAEQNPFLGYRAIRISLDREDLFRTQLRAVLRASVYGDLKLMLPMISNVQELRAAKAVIAQVREELTNEGIPFNPGLETGIMIEIPSAAVTADILAKEADFFSIGTNDLCQYTLAVDRMNDKISHLYDHFNPAVLRLIQNTIVEAGKQGIHVGMCGEMAGAPLATVLLLGMGLRDFSMSAASIPAIKEVIIKSSIAHAREICREVMEMSDAETIKAYLQQL